MRQLKTTTPSAPPADEPMTLQEAAALVARLQRISDLQTAAMTTIADAEIILDDALLACPTLEGSSEERTLHALRGKA
ncbi:MAG: hypothetical protein EKK41_21425 [Hyphomicrobiales bacterium]|nr:MAG: hypothetical protein EKK41_21425 [Hyphomicrobiales bacterium]